MHRLSGRVHGYVLLVAILLIPAAQAAEPQERGLRGIYFKRGVPAPVGENVQPVLDLSWDEKNPAPGVGANVSFMKARWMGMLEAPADGDYVLRMTADDGGRVALDGRVVIDALYMRAQVAYETAPLRLEAGRKYDLAVELFNVHPPVGMRLEWKTPGAIDFAIIAQQYLHPHFPEPSGPALAAPRIEARQTDEPTRVRLHATTGALVYYTLDGSEPTRERGTLYTTPIAVTRKLILKARAMRAGQPDSPVAEMAFDIQPAAPKVTFNNFRSGNSLTENALTFLPELAAAAGHRYTTDKVSAPGARTRNLWQGVESDLSKVAKKGPYDAYITQPFGKADDPSEVEFTGKFFDLVSQSSPNATLWVYIQWPGVKTLPSGDVDAADWMKRVGPYLAAYERLRVALEAKYPQRVVRFIPAGQALLALKKEIEAGNVPGMSDFFRETIRDGVHMTRKGSYMVGLVHFACLYGQSPEGLIVEDTGLTPEQEAVYQRIAWETVQFHPHTGRAAPSE